MRTEILLAGTGGRGVILAGALFSKASSKAGLNASYGAIYGAEVRGGLTAAEIVVSPEPIDFPMVEVPDVSFAFDQRSYEAYVLPKEPRRLVLLDGDFIELKKEHEVEVRRVPFTLLASKELGSERVANLALLGYLAAITGLFGPEEMAQALKEDVSPKYQEINLRAFELGYGLGLKDGKLDG